MSSDDTKATAGSDDTAPLGATPARREVVAVSVAAAAALLVGTSSAKAKPVKTTFTILHTNDMHSAFIGMGPSSDYTPFTLNDDATRGGYARLAGLIAKRRAAREKLGPVLVLDAGDYSMGTAFGAASRETASELRVMSRMGYDATTFGNHDFDLRPEGLGRSIGVAAKAGRIPTIVAANTDVSAADPALARLQQLSKDGVIRRYVVIERGGLRFGVFGVLGKEAQFYTTGADAITFADANETAAAVVKELRETEKVDVVICLSHGGVLTDKDGGHTDGDDVRVAKSAPGIDVVIGGHSHTELKAPIIVNGRTPVVQTGLEARNLGELVLTLDGDKVAVESYMLHPIDDTVEGDHGVEDLIDQLKPAVTAAVFASRGYSIDQPLAKISQDLPNTFTDVAASTILANLTTDAMRSATGADVAFNAGGMVRAGLKKGKSGVQTVYDVFGVAPLGAGVVDDTAGSALVTAYFTGLELKNLLEFFLVDNPAHPGEYYPRTSGLRFRYDKSRPTFDVVTAIEVGDFDRGYKGIDITGKDARLYSLTCSLYLGIILVAIPKYTKGKLTLQAKNKAGQPLTSRVEALDDPRDDTPYLLPPPGKLDETSIQTSKVAGAPREIKEWQAIMDHLRSLPVSPGDTLPTIPVDARAAEVRAIRAATERSLSGTREAHPGHHLG
ncbi:MAG TPA: bifunctional UDP-sugar hydrolase/5'-nucleotidase [Methylomirabilota bacterium]|nr:bifunctional UDP-sugar hydrolase/5'-nucleotidase [Methylomirabilota bacterium]